MHIWIIKQKLKKKNTKQKNNKQTRKKKKKKKKELAIISDLHMTNAKTFVIA
jgi:hypothetical protein